MSAAKCGGRHRGAVAALLRAYLFGVIVAIAVGASCALREPASTPADTTEVSGWMAPVPLDWPTAPWSTARLAERWGRATWELHGNPPRSDGRNANGFAAQWVMRVGWPLPAFECVRNRLRSLWDQGDVRTEPWEGPSAMLHEGLVTPMASITGVDDVFILPIVPLWWGLLVDGAVWGVPVYLVGILSRCLRKRRARLDARSTH